jgi:hypothetical protein
MKNGTRKKTNSVPKSPESLDLRAEIEKRAYEIWLNEGGSHGSDLDHWLQAERELTGVPLSAERETSA